MAAIAGRNRLSNLYTGWRVKPRSAHRRGRGSASVDLRAGFTRQGRATRDGIESDSCPTSYARAAWVNDGGPDSNEAPTTPVSAARDTKRAESAAAVAIIVALSAIAPLSTDMFLPSLPTLADRFRASDATVQLAITFFLVSFAASQLVYGPASDRYGRRPLLTAGLSLFVAGSILAVNATSIEMLLAGRVLQGLGGGAGPALSQAIVLDVYGRERAGRMLAYISIVLPLAPTLAPIVGGGLQEAFGWQSVFVLLAIIGVVLLTGYRAILPETNSRIGRSGRGFGGLAADYRHLLASPTYVAYVLAIGLMFSGYLAFISSSSFVLQDELGLGAATYGLSFGFVALGLMDGSDDLEPACRASAAGASRPSRHRHGDGRGRHHGGSRLVRRWRSGGCTGADVWGGGGRWHHAAGGAGGRVGAFPSDSRAGFRALGLHPDPDGIVIQHRLRGGRVGVSQRALATPCCWP